MFLHEGASPSFVFTNNPGSLDPSSFITFWVVRFHFFFTGRFPQFDEHNFSDGLNSTTQPPTSYLMPQDVAGSGSDLWTLH